MAKTITEILLSSQNSPCRGMYKEENQRIISNLGNLKKDLDKKQKRLLLRIIDDKDLIAEMRDFESFTNGFRLATKLMIDALYLD